MSEGLKIVKATFAKSLTPNQEPAQPAQVDAAGRGTFEVTDEKLYISLALADLPHKGFLLFEVLHKDTPQVRAVLADFAQVPAAARARSPVFLGTYWEPEARIISDQYVFAFYFKPDEQSAPQPLGRYGLSIVPPAGALRSRIASVVLTGGATPTHDPLPAPAQFGFNQPVYLVMRGDLGKGSHLSVQWDRGGQGMTQSIHLTQNQKDQKFSLYFLPETGWSTGDHQATVFLNDQEVGRYTFRVGPGRPAA